MYVSLSLLSFLSSLIQVVRHLSLPFSAASSPSSLSRPRYLPSSYLPSSPSTPSPWEAETWVGNGPLFC